MRVSGYGEFQQMRKLIQKDDAQEKNKKGADGASDVTSPGDSDAVQISGEARRKNKLRQTSEFRDAKVSDVRERMEAGILITPESLRSSALKMLDSLASSKL